VLYTCGGKQPVQSGIGFEETDSIKVYICLLSQSSSPPLT
jgi:hypothetical protein